LRHEKLIFHAESDIMSGWAGMEQSRSSCCGQC